MLYYLMEDRIRKYTWNQLPIQALKDEMRRKHVQIQEIDSLTEIPSEDEEACVLLLGASDLWRRQMVEEACRKKLLIICASRRKEAFASTVSCDTQEVVYLAVEYLYSLGRKRMALYSVNPASSYDPELAQIFVSLTGREKDVYVNDSTLQELYGRIEPRLDEYDGILCTNEYAAVSLLRHMREKKMPISSLYVISLSDSKLLEYISPTVTAVSGSNAGFGRSVYAVYRLLTQDRGEVTSVNVYMKNNLVVRGSTENRPFIRDAIIPAMEVRPVDNSFFTDREIQDIAQLGTLLSEGDDIDLLIIDSLVNGLSNQEIAERCFLSETAVKYRIKSMREVCAGQDRKALVDYLSKYIAR